MSANNKRDDFTRADLLSVGQNMGIRKANLIVEQITDVVSDWEKYAGSSGVNKSYKEQISRNLRLYM